MKQVIGFANQFYTLWDYEVEINYVTNSYGQHFPSSKTIKYYFRKNISIDLDKVKMLHPDLSIDESLRGKHSSWDYQERVELPNDYFWFGKYYGKKVDDILQSDMNYCEWVVSSNSSRQADYIKSHPIYIEHIAKIQSEKDSLIASSGALKVGDEVELEFISNGFNVDEEMNRCIVKATKDDSDVVFWVAINGYKLVGGRFPYVMPNINGKCQKTKGKRFVVKVYEVQEPQIDRWNNISQFIKIC
jgi:hypothetical protein